MSLAFTHEGAGDRLTRADRYDRALNVWPIRNAADYRRAARELDRLVVLPLRALSPEERDRMEIFTRLIEAYDAEHRDPSLPRPSPVELLRALMEEHAMTASDLGRLLGNRSVGCLILQGKRGLSKRHILILADRFRLSPAAFL
jgi:HTH-type transcriptional regulator/antitoxin HigA